MGDHTPDERQERSRRVADATASGQQPSPNFLADAEDYIEGRIDGDELVHRARRRWGIPDP